MATAERTEPAGGPVVAIGSWFFRYRNAAFPVVLLALFAALPPRPLLGDPALDGWMDLAGVVVALSGSGFRAWVIGLAYIKRGGVDKRVHADRLVTTGMFGVCRNPLYLGNALVLFGLFAIHNHPLVYLLGGGFFGFAYWSIVRAEERYLAARFGAAYRRYCRDVPRFVPAFGRLQAATAGTAFNWRRALAKDYGSIYAWIAAAVLLRLHAAAPPDGPQLAWAAAVLVSGGLTVLGVRVLKKSGRLRPG